MCAWMCWVVECLARCCLIHRRACCETRAFITHAQHQQIATHKFAAADSRAFFSVHTQIAGVGFVTGSGYIILHPSVARAVRVATLEIIMVRIGEGPAHLICAVPITGNCVGSKDGLHVYAGERSSKTCSKAQYVQSTTCTRWKPPRLLTFVAVVTIDCSETTIVVSIDQRMRMRCVRVNGGCMREPGLGFETREQAPSIGRHKNPHQRG